MARHVLVRSQEDRDPESRMNASARPDADGGQPRAATSPPRPEGYGSGGPPRAPGGPLVRPPRMTTRRWMIAVAVAAWLSTRLLARLKRYRMRVHYLNRAIGHFA